jgi:hypothetical protein
VCLGKAANGAGLLRAQLRIMGSEQKVLHLPHVAHAARVPKRAAVIQQMDTETVGLQAPLGMEHGRGAIELVQRVGRSHGSEPHPGAEPRKNCEAGTRTRVRAQRASTSYPGTHALSTTKKQNYQQQQKQPKCESVAAATATAAVAAAAANSNNSGAGSSNKSNRVRAGSESSSNSCKTKRKQLQQQQKR